MRRIISIFLSFVVLCGLSVGSVGAVQEATPAVGEGHLIVGAWFIDTDTADPENSVTLGVFTSDGVYFQTEPGEGGSYVSLGSWEPTGETTANMTFWGLEPDGSMIVVRASLETLDGQSVTAEYTIEFIGADGTSTGQAGPGMAEGNRIPVEGPGTPVGSLEDVFGPLEEEATPAG